MDRHGKKMGQRYHPYPGHSRWNEKDKHSYPGHSRWNEKDKHSYPGHSRWNEKDKHAYQRRERNISGNSKIKSYRKSKNLFEDTFGKIEEKFFKTGDDVACIELKMNGKTYKGTGNTKEEAEEEAYLKILKEKYYTDFCNARGLEKYNNLAHYLTQKALKKEEEEKKKDDEAFEVFKVLYPEKDLQIFEKNNQMRCLVRWRQTSSGQSFVIYADGDDEHIMKNEVAIKCLNEFSEFKIDKESGAILTDEKEYDTVEEDIDATRRKENPYYDQPNINNFILMGDSHMARLNALNRNSPTQKPLFIKSGLRVGELITLIEENGAPEKCVVLIGTVDIRDSRETPEKIINRLRIKIKELFTILIQKGAKNIVVVKIPPLKFRKSVVNRHNDIMKIVLESAPFKSSVLLLEAVFKKNHLHRDGTHLKSQGYQALKAAIEKLTMFAGSKAWPLQSSMETSDETEDWPPLSAKESEQGRSQHLA